MNLRMAIVSILVLAVASGGAIVVGAGSGDDGSPEPLERIISEVRQGAAPKVLDALRDGVVTFEEHESAILRTAACASELGVAVELRPGGEGRSTDLGFSASSLEKAESSRLLLEECKAQHLNGLHKVWGAQHRPSESELAQGRALLAECMEANGVDVPKDGPLSERQLIAWAQSEDQDVWTANAICVDRHYAELGFWP